jgi:hypothetical protein
MPGEAGPIASVLGAGLLGIVGFGSLLFIGIGVARQAALAARAAKAAEAASAREGLAPGYAVLHGRVETGDALPAVSVRIRQAGHVHKVLRGVQHTWTEIDRHVDARPFTLELASGARVRIVPDGSVVLVDHLSAGPIEPGTAGSWPSPLVATRTRTAELMPGDLAYVSGQLVCPVGLGTAYRSSEEGLTLHAPRRGKMLVSTAPLEERFTRRAQFHLAWVLGFAVAFVAANGALFGPFWLRFFCGRSLTGDVSDTRTWTTSSKSATRRHYDVEAHALLDHDDLNLSVETNEEFSRQLRAALERGDKEIQAPFVVVPFYLDASDIGTVATLQVKTCIWGASCLLVLSLYYLFDAQRSRPWYERRRLIERGSGPFEAG